ncbi:MAG: hypothetical protein WD097_01030 [Balneolales bacterium]
MANISRLEVFGPKSSLQRMGESMLKETSHVYSFTREISDEEKVWVFLYEDRSTTIQNTKCLTCILSEEAAKIRLEIVDIGKQSGFGGSSILEEQPIHDQLMEFILDFGKQFGLTIQNKKE